MKDFIIGLLIVILVINTIFIACCLKLNSQIDEEDEFEDREE